MREYTTSDTLARPFGCRPEVIVATDGELLMRFARHGDHRAFAQIVERHGGLVWIVCREVLRHHQDVEDAFQATFLILAQRARLIRSSDSASAWLYKVAMRTALAARRKRACRREEPLVAEPLAIEKNSTIDDREMIYVLLQELRFLPARYQTPLVMRYLEGQSRRAIAEQTDATVAQIQGRLARGRRILRARFLRRGVSLSLAVGAVASTAESTRAALSPALVGQTAANCVSTEISGAAGRLSPAALALAKDGVNAMWIAFATKCTAVVSSLVLAGGILLAAQQDNHAGSAAGNAAPKQVNLLSASEKTDDGQKPGAQLGGRADERPGDERSGAAFVAGRLKYKVPFAIGDTEFKEGGRIEITEVWGTRPRIEVGGQYMVRGKYVLPKGERGKLYFYATATGNWGREPTADMDLQSVELDQESGEFTLVHGMAGPGYFHLYLASPDKYSRTFANVYFGTGNNVLRHKNWSAAEEKTPPTSAAPTTAAAAAAAEMTSPAESVAETKLRNLNISSQENAGRAADEKRAQIAKAVAELQEALSSQIADKAKARAGLELQEIEKSLLRRELEATHSKLMELNLSPNRDESGEAQKRRNEQLETSMKQIEITKDKLRHATLEAAQMSAEMERSELRLGGVRQKLEELQRLQLQMEFAPRAGATPALQSATSVNLPADARDVFVPTDGPAATSQVRVPLPPGPVEPVDGSQERKDKTSQLELERDSWRLKAEGYRLKAKATLAEMDAGHGGSTSRADALLMQADANHAEAMARELDKQLENLKRDAKPAQPSSSEMGDVLRPGDEVEIVLSPRDPHATAPTLRVRLDANGQVQIDPKMPPVEISGVDPRRAEKIIRDFFGTPTSRYKAVLVHRVDSDNNSQRSEIPR